MENLDRFERMWGVSPSDPHKAVKPAEIANLCSHVLNIQDTDCSEHILSTFKEHIDDIVDVYNQFEHETFDIKCRVNRLLEIAYYAQSICSGISCIRNALDHNHCASDNMDASLFRFRSIDMQSNSAYQNFLLYILGHFYKNKYAKYQGDVYKVISTPEGFNTSAWKRVGTINEIIYDSICKETNYDQFLNVTKRGDCVRVASEFLTNCKDSQFPDLIKNRSVFSFRNGIYFAHDDKFVAYNDSPEQVVSAKYFNQTFEKAEHWQDIQTPYFDSIFSHQKISEEVMRWVYVLTGRLIYEIDAKDGWQVIFFIQGQAGTGKSTYANSVCKQLKRKMWESCQTTSKRFSD